MRIDRVSSARDPSALVPSRREVLAGAAAVALAAGAPKVFASSGKGRRKARRDSVGATISLRRYMAASAMLPDGKILVTGGYDRAWTSKSSPRPLNSAVILDPVRGTCRPAASMAVPRARHAAVALSDGRVAVVGGLGSAPTASVEVYDPVLDAWFVAQPLAQPRYDHCAVADGTLIHVIGGNSQALLSSIEVLEVAVLRSVRPSG